MSCGRSHAREWSAAVRRNIALGGNYRVLTLELPRAFPDARAGSFVMLSCGAEPWILLRRPMAVYDLRRSRKGTELDVLYSVFGRGTAQMALLRPGTPLSLLGPIGNRFSQPEAKEKIWAVAGGTGIAPFLLWARQIGAARKRSRILLGFRTRSQLGVARDFRRVGLAPDCAVEGPGGRFRGTVVDLLLDALERDGKPDRILTCGPEAMMEKVADLARSRGIPCEVSLEAKMGCGMGVCLSCVTAFPGGRRPGGYALVCQDGPVFTV